MSKRPVIAVVDHDTDFIDLMKDLLEEEGYATLLLNEIDTAYQNIKEYRPTLAIVDIALGNPESGFRLIDILRLDPEMAELPIIITTTETSLIRDNEARLQEKNCHILMKPFGIDELYEKVAALVGRP